MPEIMKIPYETSDGLMASLEIKPRLLTPAVIRDMAALDGKFANPRKQAKQFLLLDKKSMKEVLKEFGDSIKDSPVALSIINSLMLKLEAGSLSEDDLMALFETGAQGVMQNFEISKQMVQTLTDRKQFTTEQKELFDSPEFWDSVDMEAVREIAESFRKRLRFSD